MKLFSFVVYLIMAWYNILFIPSILYPVVLVSTIILDLCLVLNIYLKFDYCNLRISQLIIYILFVLLIFILLLIEIMHTISALHLDHYMAKTWMLLADDQPYNLTLRDLAGRLAEGKRLVMESRMAVGNTNGTVTLANLGYRQGNLSMNIPAVGEQDIYLLERFLDRHPVQAGFAFSQYYRWETIGHSDNHGLTRTLSVNITPHLLDALAHCRDNFI